MKRNFYQEEFEELIKQKADQYRMYPSEKVWKGINRSLHSRRKWYWSGFVLLLSGVSYFAIHELISPSQHRITSNTGNTSVDPASRNEAKIIPFKEFSVNSSPEEKQISLTRNFSHTPVIMLADVIAFKELSIPVHPQHTIVSDNNNHLLVPGLLMPSLSPGMQSEEFADVANLSVRTPEPRYDAVASPLQKESSMQQPGAIEDILKINWLQEMAVYELLIPRTKRTSLQFAFSPTMNYRKLTGSRNAMFRTDAKNIPMALKIEGDLDQLVNHKPALGFEIGSSILYEVNKNLTLKAGIQFNYSRYDIQAYSSYSAEIATIALNSQYGIDMDSITNYTRIRNFGGDEPESLQNQYFQFSSPVGMEYRLFGNDRIQLKIASSIQPTFLINRNSYLITTDYKNYTREPSLVRRWNVNTNAEAFIAYKAAGLKWQVGPQFRYQLLSSYANKYPIKEYLMEYGIKVGVSKTFR